MKVIKWLLILIVVLLILAQAIRPSMTNASVDPTRTIESRTQMTPQVSAVLRRSCSDCHTTTTRWPWYSQIAPVSWYLASDVNDGRRHLNLSDWASNDTKRALTKLDEMCEEVQHDAMPPKPYLLIHTDAKLSDTDKKMICDWTSAERERIQSGQAAK
jgi:hypothetical protein